MPSKKNEKKFWFKRKRYGYGWAPSTWQGWLVIAVYVVGIFVATLDLLPVDLRDEDVTN